MLSIMSRAYLAICLYSFGKYFKFSLLHYFIFLKIRYNLNAIKCTCFSVQLCVLTNAYSHESTTIIKL